jgi:hypothetical protein
LKVEACAHPKFARHESFHPRYGWLKKGIDGALVDPGVFAREDAVVELGVGKNMVRAIRFWGTAAKLLTTAPNTSRPRQPLVVPTHLGRAVFHDDGWDPYSEDPGTLWLVHWLLLAPKSSVPVWWIALNEFPGVEFSADELHDFVVDFTNGIGDWDDVQPSSIRKDVDCFIRMYTAANNQARITGDDAVDCPFRELGILRQASQRRRFRFVQGDKPGLPPQIALYAALDFVARIEHRAATVTLSRLVNEPGSPGRAFRIPESTFATLLGSAAESVPDVELVTTNGVTQLAIDGSPSEIASSALRLHYASAGASAVAIDTPLAGPAAEEPADSAARTEATQ